MGPGNPIVQVWKREMRHALKFCDLVWVGCSLRRIAGIVVVQPLFGSEDENWESGVVVKL